jgi:hypothetical protein
MGSMFSGQAIYVLRPLQLGRFCEVSKFLEGEGAGAAVGGEIGRERGDAFKDKEVLC